MLAANTTSEVLHKCHLKEVRARNDPRQVLQGRVIEECEQAGTRSGIRCDIARSILQETLTELHSQRARLAISEVTADTVVDITVISIRYTSLPFRVMRIRYKLRSYISETDP